MAHSENTAILGFTIRHVNCELVIGQGERCRQCVKYRQTLLVLCHRKEQHANSGLARADPSSHANYRYLNTPEKVERLRQLHHQSRIALRKVAHLKAKLSQVISQQAVVDEVVASDLSSIVAEENGQVEAMYPKGSFQRLFWEQQREAATKKDSRGRRWHPLMIRFCLYLRHQSNKAYETLRQSGVISLLSQRTLRDYSHAITAKPGFSDAVDQQLMLAAKVATCREWEKLLVILIDEMYIKEDLVYDKHHGTLIGFVNLGDINDHLLAFERSLEQETNTNPPLAKTVVTFMVRGLFSPLRYV